MGVFLCFSSTLERATCTIDVYKDEDLCLPVKNELQRNGSEGRWSVLKTYSLKVF